MYQKRTKGEGVRLLSSDLNWIFEYDYSVKTVRKRLRISKPKIDFSTWRLKINGITPFFCISTGLADKPGYFFFSSVYYVWLWNYFSLTWKYFKESQWLIIGPGYDSLSADISLFCGSLYSAGCISQSLHCDAIAELWCYFPRLILLRRSAMIS